MTKSNTKKSVRFAICISNDLPSLQPRKIYRVLPDAHAEAIEWIRVVDDFDEDYLYPASDFIFLDLPAKARRLMTSTSASSRGISLRSDLLLFVIVQVARLDPHHADRSFGSRFGRSERLAAIRG
jgi:hypothetical protein